MSFLSRIARQASALAPAVPSARPKGLGSAIPPADPIIAPPVPVENVAPVHDRSPSARLPDPVAKTEDPPDPRLEQPHAVEDHQVEQPAERVVAPPLNDEPPIEPDPVAPMPPIGPADRADDKSIEPPAIETEGFAELPPPQRPPIPDYPDTLAETSAETTEPDAASPDILKPPAIASLAALEAEIESRSPPDSATAETGPQTITSVVPDAGREPTKPGEEPEPASAAQEPASQPEIQPIVASTPADVRPVEKAVSPAEPPLAQTPIEVVQPSQPPQPPAPEPQPTVQIGQIDVVVAEPVSAHPAAAAPSRLAAVSASRRYLRRL